jgi:hypothetical protein
LPLHPAVNLTLSPTFAPRLHSQSQHAANSVAASPARPRAFPLGPLSPLALLPLSSARPPHTSSSSASNLLALASIAQANEFLTQSPTAIDSAPKLRGKSVKGAHAKKRKRRKESAHHEYQEEQEEDEQESKEELGEANDDDNANDCEWNAENEESRMVADDSIVFVETADDEQDEAIPDFTYSHHEYHRRTDHERSSPSLTTSPTASSSSSSSFSGYTNLRALFQSEWLDEDEDDEENDPEYLPRSASVSVSDDLTDDNELIARRTRARHPLTDISIEELEKHLENEFNERKKETEKDRFPSAAMSVELETSERKAGPSAELEEDEEDGQDREEYFRFLDHLRSGYQEFPREDEDEVDEEYLPTEEDADDAETEEEYREDRAVRVSKKEVRELRKQITNAQPQTVSGASPRKRRRTDNDLLYDDEQQVEEKIDSRTSSSSNAVSRGVATMATVLNERAPNPPAKGPVVVVPIPAALQGTLQSSALLPSSASWASSRPQLSLLAAPALSSSLPRTPAASVSSRVPLAALALNGGAAAAPVLAQIVVANPELEQQRHLASRRALSTLQSMGAYFRKHFEHQPQLGEAFFLIYRKYLRKTETADRKMRILAKYFQAPPTQQTKQQSQQLPSAQVASAKRRVVRAARRVSQPARMLLPKFWNPKTSVSGEELFSSTARQTLQLQFAAHAQLLLQMYLLVSNSGFLELGQQTRKKFEAVSPIVLSLSQPRFQFETQEAKKETHTQPAKRGAAKRKSFHPGSHGDDGANGGNGEAEKKGVAPVRNRTGRPSITEPYERLCPKRPSYALKNESMVQLFHKEHHKLTAIKAFLAQLVDELSRKKNHAQAQTPASILLSPSLLSWLHHLENRRKCEVAGAVTQMQLPTSKIFPFDAEADVDGKRMKQALERLLAKDRSAAADAATARGRRPMAQRLHNAEFLLSNLLNRWLNRVVFRHGKWKCPALTLALHDVDRRLLVEEYLPVIQPGKAMNDCWLLSEKSLFDVALTRLAISPTRQPTQAQLIHIRRRFLPSKSYWLLRQFAGKKVKQFKANAAPATAAQSAPEPQQAQASTDVDVSATWNADDDEFEEEHMDTHDLTSIAGGTNSATAAAQRETDDCDEGFEADEL